MSLTSVELLLVALIIWGSAHGHHCSSHRCANSTAKTMAIDRLYSDVIAPYSYITRPVTSPSTTTKVYFFLQFLQFVKVDEISSSLTIDVWFQVQWHDEIRCWDPADYQGIEYIIVKDSEIWRPKLIATNSIDQRFMFDSSEHSVYITNNGSSFWNPGERVSFACKLDLTQFPFDEHSCLLTIVGIDLDGEVEMIHVGINRADLQSELFHPEWEVCDIRNATTQYHSGIAGRDYQQYELRLHLRRRSGFFVVNTILPVNVLALGCLVAFIIPDDSGEKISYCVTMLLAIGIFLTTVSSHLPHASVDMPVVVIYFFCLYIYCGLALVTVVASMLWRRRGSNDVSQSANHGSDEEDLTKKKGSYPGDGGTRSDHVQMSENISRGGRWATPASLEGQRFQRVDPDMDACRQNTDTSGLRDGNRRVEALWCPWNADIVITAIFFVIYLVITITYLGLVFK